MPKPVLGMIHSLARSGATIICRHFGAMDHVALFSEIHRDGATLIKQEMPPPANAALNIRIQGAMWFGLYSAGEAQSVIAAAEEPNTPELIQEVIERCQSKGLTPVIRDWSHMDFMGLPFRAPTPHLSLYHELSGYYDIRQTSIVRHPLGNYMSMVNSATLKQFIGTDGFEHFIEGYRQFIEAVPADSMIRYEDFLADKTGTIQKLADYMGIPFDPDFETKAANNTRITGDAAGKGLTQYAGTLKTIDKAIFDMATSNNPYRNAAETAGYDPDSVPSGYTIG